MRKYDIIVIGAGHAGIEAALASARLGLKTACFTLNCDTVGNMPCNPAIGGSSKGHLVREIDALGGQMGLAADATCIQYRMLNLGKGAAVHSLRAQADRAKYCAYMKKTLEKEPNLSIRQGEIIEILTQEQTVVGVKTRTNMIYNAEAVIICSGTFLEGRIIIGQASFSGGPDGLKAATGLTDSLKSKGLSLMRFKTGTPARILASSVDFSKMENQEGDERIVPFSFETMEEIKNRARCYLTYTTEKTHQIIRDNLHRSPLFSGDIEGVGPRYCPSIEDKVVRFADKKRHQIFIEPMGLDTEELYVQGMSSSMPEEVYEEILKSVPGLENVEIIRPAYAIEYDCIDPLELKPTMETKKIKGLFGAGQFCGTSGYEEAAAQGLIAGINAARQVKGEGELILPRSSSYIGTLIDDLVTKGTNEPYRMMTSRSEYRLLLRQDNADERLTPIGYEIGLISEERFQRFTEKQGQIKAEIKRLSDTAVPPSETLNALLEGAGGAPIANPERLLSLLRRPKVGYTELMEATGLKVELPLAVAEQVEISVKYEGYIKKQMAEAEQFMKSENKKIPENMDYEKVAGLRKEAAEKLRKIRPVSLGQASRISGVNPADITALMIHMAKGDQDE